MTRMIRIVMAGVVAAFAGASSSALADGTSGSKMAQSAAAPKPFSWTGFYVGGNVGGVWSDFSRTITTAAGASETLSFDPNSFAGGAQAGYQMQMGQIVLGLEVGLTGFDLGDSKPFSSTFGPNRTQVVDIDWLFTLTPRIGFAKDNWMVYLKGGYANADVYSGSRTTSTDFQRTGTNRLQSGWTIGTGFEVGVAPWATLGLDYSYVSIDPKARPAFTQFDAVNNTNTGRFSDIDMHLLTARINFKLGDHR